MPLTRRPHERVLLGGTRVPRVYRYLDGDGGLFLRIDGFGDAGGKVVTHKVDLPAGTTVPQAMVERDRIMVEVRAGTYVREGQTRAVMTLAELTALYLDRKSGLRPSSLRAMHARAALWVDALGAHPVPSLTYRRLAPWYDDVVDAYSPTYAIRVAHDLSCVMRLGVDLGQLDRDPTALLERPEKVSEPIILPALERVEVALEHWRADEDRSSIGPLLWLVEYAAMRPGEVCRLTWDRVDLVEGSIRIDREHSKTKRPRTVPLGRAGVDVLRAHFRRTLDHGTEAQRNEARAGGLAFPSLTGSIYTPSHIGEHRVWLRGCEVAGLTPGREHGWTPHRLRYCGISRWLRAGMSERMVRLIAGHDARSSHVQYARVFADELADAGALMDAARAPRQRAHSTEPAYSEREQNGDTRPANDTDTEAK